VGYNAQTVTPDRPVFDEAGGHLIAFVFELFVGQANVIVNNRFAIGEIMRIATDDIVYGKVLEWHFGVLSFVFSPKKIKSRTVYLNIVESLNVKNSKHPRQKDGGQANSKAPNHNTQITNKFQIPIFNVQNLRF
jgi:hypothetical protein